MRQMAILAFLFPVRFLTILVAVHGESAGGTFFRGIWATAVEASSGVLACFENNFFLRSVEIRVEIGGTHCLSVKMVKAFGLEYASKDIMRRFLMRTNLK